ncbi:S1/P1 nuclease [Sphingomonas xanthus]|uniref:S1/P1 nuclease n=2 Tax=Sphingomonas xanthus TaxID=2594473 RepID=A0A516IUJ0_9SPHN|nr:S1/P1 nuclease [Sphingomonas xanthus]
MLMLAALVALLGFARPAGAYWEYGHESVARIAWLQMSAQSRSQVASLLRQGKLLETPDCPVTTLEQASLWADCIKPLGDRFGYAFSWHYQNVDICKPFDLKAACKDGNCVSVQIERNARLLADRGVPTRERLMALAFLAHFVGDLHQPMHAGDHQDLGGNRVAANYGIIGGRTNLHGIWDGWLAERAISTPPAGPAAMLAQVPQAERIQVSRGTVEEWSREMWGKARDLAYKTLLTDPCGAEPPERPVLGEAEVNVLIPEVKRNVVAGGIRLARLIDDALIHGKAPGQR